MVIGSTIIPGAIILVNNDLTDSVKTRLATQLHIDEIIPGLEFDLRLAADPNYSQNIRILKRRLLVIRNLTDTTNRQEMDIVIFVKNGLASVVNNCYGPSGQTYPVKNIHWGALCIYNTNINGTCLKTKTCSSCNSTDGYLQSPYYPARFDPYYPQENHPYNQIKSTDIFGNKFNKTDRCLCGQYNCNSTNCIPKSSCRLVKQ